MARRIKILIADTDIDFLKKLYLCLIHKKYKVEATMHVDEIISRILRFKPNLIIIGNISESISNDIYDFIKKSRIQVLFIREMNSNANAHELKKFDFINKATGTNEIDRIIKEMFDLFL